MPKYIDLTHIIDPAKVERKFSIETIGAETVNHNVVRLQGQWYIMTNISMVSHIGTHIEVPYHILPDGMDLSQVPVDRYCGEAIVLRFADIPARAPISAQRVEAAADRAGGIKKGDIVLCDLGYSDFYGEERYKESPHFSAEAIRFLVKSGIKMMGVDAGGVEIPASEEHVNHKALFENNILLIENLAHMNQLTQHRLKVYAFPIPVKGVESFPVRVVAEEGD